MEEADELFQLQDNESYDKLCAEVFLTTLGRFAFHCTLCEAKYCGYDTFLTHLYDQHLTTLEFLEDNEDIENVDLKSENVNDTDEYEKPYVTIEIEPLINEVTLKEEISMPLLQKDEQIKKDFIVGEGSTRTEPNNRRTKRKKRVKSESPDDFMDELKIPEKIREVKKRTLRGPFITPAEERKHKCPICGLAFKERHNMRHHFKRHSNEKNHECPQCYKKFYTPTEVRIHMQFHTRVRSFLCSDCGRAFLTKSHLDSHAKRHTNQRDFKCSICHKAFYSNGQLKSHMQGHSAERPFSCDLCVAAFSRKEALKNHMKLHENKREYKCNLCDAEFNQKAGLFSHMKAAHKKTS